jgi:hypothetical protein
MRPANICFLIALSLCALIPAVSGDAQSTTAEPHIPAFNQLFKQSTGLNGYEDLVMAGDIVYGNPALDATQNSVSATSLSAMRRALASQDAQRALALIRSGLDKPITSPRTSFDYSTLLPEYSEFRALARLLMAEQYVLLADGQTDSAIKNLRDGLRLGQAARTEHLLISELVGIAIDRIVIGQIANHLNQLCEHDCDSLIKLLEEWRSGAVHSPVPSLLRERDTALQELERVRRDPGHMLTELFPDSMIADDPQAAANRAALLAANSATIEQTVDEAADLIKQQCDTMISSLQLPPWQRPEVKIPEGKSLGNRLFQMFVPNYDQVLSRFLLDDVNLQLLAVHTAIRRYRWQYDRLPDRLEQLRLDELATDPFTGKPLIYQRNGENYTLFSAGANDHDDNGARIPGKRTPINLIR